MEVRALVGNQRHDLLAKKFPTFVNEALQSQITLITNDNMNVHLY